MSLVLEPTKGRSLLGMESTMTIHQPLDTISAAPAISRLRTRFSTVPLAAHA